MVMPMNEEFAEIQENNTIEQMADDTNPAEIDFLKKEIVKQLKRAQKAKHLDTKVELVNNIYPILQSIVDWVDSGFMEVYETLAAEDEEEDEDFEDEETEEGIFVPYSLYDKATECLNLLSLEGDDRAKALYTELVTYKEAELAREAAEDDQDDEGEEE